MLDRCCLLNIHEDAEANEHKNNGMIAILAGHAGNMATGMHTATTGVIGDLYPSIANDVFGAKIEEFPAANQKLDGIVG